jgi:hypothetical protein
MNAPTTQECFIANGKVYEVFTIILHTQQVTQAMNLLETKPKQIFILVVTSLFQAWSQYFQCMPCIWQGL